MLVVPAAYAHFAEFSPNSKPKLFYFQENSQWGSFMHDTEQIIFQVLSLLLVEQPLLYTLSSYYLL